MFVKSTKLFDRLPVAHCQYFDRDSSGEEFSGACAKLHGYSRSYKFEFSGTPDENGWIVPFGHLKKVRQFLEYYFDHTAVVPADDPRIEKYKQANEDGLIVLRILPYGVSMEMSALFVWELTNAYIMETTGARCFVSKVEAREHEPNSAMVEVSYQEALDSYQKLRKCFGDIPAPEVFLVKKPNWEYCSPHHLGFVFEK